MTGRSTVDFSPLERAKVTQGEFAELLGVSRVTVSNWIHGITNIHPERVRRVARLLAVINKAAEDGALPVPPKTLRRERLGVIKMAVIPYLRKDS